MNKTVIISISIATVVILGLGIWLTAPKPLKANPPVDAFAKCLTDKGAVMHGAYWCPHCQAQKKLFGDSFQYVTYVECTVDTKICLDRGVQSYPTWIFADGSRETGELPFDELSKKTSCPVPTQ